MKRTDAKMPKHLGRNLYGSLGREYAEPLAAPGTTGAAGAGVDGMAGMAGATDLWDLEPGRDVRDVPEYMGHGISDSWLVSDGYNML